MKSALQIGLVVTLAFGLVLVAYSYVSVETPIYYWDYSNYDRQLNGLAHLLRTSGLFAFLDSLVSSIRFSDYNPTPILPLIPISLLAPDSRIGFICGLMLIGFLPVLLLASIFSQISWIYPRRTRLLSWFLLPPLLAPLLWISPLRGYPDLIALVPFAWLTLSAIRTHSFTSLNRSSSFFVGLLFWTTFLLRRYFVFSLLVFFFAHFFVACRSAGARHSCINYFFITIGALIPCILFQHGLLERIIATSYADIYAAYDLGFYGNFHALYAIIGPVWLVFCCVGIFIAIVQRRHWVFFHFFLAVLTFLFFQFTQKPGPHHLLPIFFWTLPAISWPIWLQQRSPSHLQRTLAIALSLPLLLLTWFATFLPGRCFSSTTRFSIFESLICPQRRFPPLRLMYWSQLNHLVHWLSLRLHPGTRVAVVASSPELNAEILSSMLAKAGHFQVNSLGDIDQRDGFDLAYLHRADVLITTDPPLLHRPAQHQRVVTIPASLFAHSPPILINGWTLWTTYQLGKPPTKLRLLVFRRKQPSLSANNYLHERELFISAFRRSGAKINVSADRINF